jgi:UDP-GlcNAc:undecaprenyl-phosphate GlcNAc-1-phosphate transferase
MAWVEVLGAGMAAFVLVLVGITPVRRLALRLGAVRDAVGRHVRSAPVPRLGGIALLAAFILVALLHPTLVLTRAIWALCIGLLLLLAVGAADDIRDLPWWMLFLAQVSAAALFVFGGNISLEYLNAPFAEGEALRLDTFVWLPQLIAVLWLLVVMNAMNWLDGSDGVASGVGVLGLSVLCTLSMSTVVLQPPLAILAAAGAGAAWGFLARNRPPASIFLGSAGSFGLGFLIGGLAILAGAKLATAATVLLLPLADMAAVLTKRLLRGHPLTQGDTSHLHHVLAARGVSAGGILLLHIVVAGAAGAAALLLPRAAKSITLLAGFVLLWALLLVLDRPLRK